MVRSTPVLAVAALCGLTAAACAPKVDLDAARAALQAADSAYTATITAMDPNAFAASYAADAKMYPPNDSARTGTAAITAFANQLFSAPGMSVTFHPLGAEVGAGGDMGYTVSHYVVSVTGPDGQPHTDQGHDFHVWRKQADGSWKIVQDIWNSEVPMPAPVPAPAPTRRR